MKQNVLFILVDCLRADKCYGNNRTAKTPNIDSLIKNGIFFSKTIATTTTTTPSVASIFTGLYTFAHGIRSLHGYKLASDVTTLAEIFKENGYNTYAEVTGPLLQSTGLDRGFDSFYHRRFKEYFVGEWGDDFIKKFKKGKFREPWFIFAHLWELHVPRRIPDRFNNKNFGTNRYDRALSGLDVKLGELLRCIDFDSTVVVLHGDHGEKIMKNMFIEDLYEFKEYLRWMSREHLAGLIRKIFQVTKINYEKLPDFAKPKYHSAIRKPKPFSQLRGHGFNIYDDAIVIPLVIAGHGESFKANKMIKVPVRQIDIVPTLIEGLDLRITGNIQCTHGRSLMPLIKGDDLPELPAYCETCGGILADKKYWKVGIRGEKYKYIYRPYHKDKHEELYDLENDPSEKKNLIKIKPEIANHMKKQLVRISADDRNNIKLVGEQMSEDESMKLAERLRTLGYI